MLFCDSEGNRSKKGKPQNADIPIDHGREFSSTGTIIQERVRARYFFAEASSKRLVDIMKARVKIITMDEELEMRRRCLPEARLPRQRLPRFLVAPRAADKTGSRGG